jgi:rod shape-determining protein MreC
MFQRIFKKKITIWILILAAVLLLIWGLLSIFSDGSTVFHRAVRAVSAPVQKMFTSASNRVSHFFSAYTRYNALLEENERLREENYAMKEAVRNADLYRVENENLRALLDMRQRHTDLTLESAMLIARSDTAWSSVITLNKGESEGFAVGNGVISREGLVGQIISVGAGYAEVGTIIDTKVSVGALISRNRLSAVTKGTLDLMPEGKFQLTGLPRGSDVRPGDEVETSGLGGMLPPGLLLGTVESVHADSSGLGDYAIVKAAADIENLSQLFAITAYSVSD